MPITVKELRRHTQTDGSDQAFSRDYKLWGSYIADEIELALLTGADTSPPFGGINGVATSLVLKTIELESLEDDASVWDAQATWGRAKQLKPPETNDEDISFDISPQTTRTTQSRSTVSKTAVSGTAPDFKGGIEWDGNAFQGVDIMSEAFSFTITKYVPNSEVTNAYIQSLRNSAFRTNTAQFRGHAPGECLYVGAAGSMRNDDDFTIAHKFMGIKNATAISIGDITVATKNGWDLLWVLYEEEEDGVAKFITPRPKAAYVERMYDSIDFPPNIGVGA